MITIPKDMVECVRAHPGLVVDISDFTIERSVGRGGAGEVFKAYDSKKKVECAVKQLYEENLKPLQMSRLIREIHTMALCHNRFCIPIKGFTAVPPYSIVLEYLDNGSLDDAIFKHGKTIGETQMNIIALCIANGMAHIHSHNLFHRDLKPGNILLDNRTLPRICDFGLARIDDSAKITKGIGTPVYMAPEQIRDKVYDKRVDVYSYGIMLYEMVERTRAYTGYESKVELINAVVDGARPTFTRKTSLAMSKLIQRCWDKDPAKRPTFNEIFEKLASGEAKFKDADFSVVKKVVDQIRANEESYSRKQTEPTKPRVNLDALFEKLGASREPEPPQPKPKMQNMFNCPSDDSSDVDIGDTPIKPLNLKPSIFDDDFKANDVALDARRDVDFIDKEEKIVMDDTAGVTPQYTTAKNPLFQNNAQMPMQMMGRSPIGGPSLTKARQQAVLSKKVLGNKNAPPQFSNMPFQAFGPSGTGNVPFPSPFGQQGLPPFSMQQSSSNDMLAQQNKSAQVKKVSVNGEHPCPEVKIPQEESIPQQLPPKPASTPVFLPVPNYPEGSPEPFSQPFSNLPIEPQLLSSPNNPAFVSSVTTLGRLATSNDIQACAQVLSPYTAKNTPANAQLAVLKTMFRIAMKDKSFIDMIASHGAFQGMPFASSECEIAAADLLSLACKFRPSIIDSTFFPMIIYLAKSRPLDVTLLFKFLIDSYDQLDPSVPPFILTTTSLLANTRASSRAVSIIALLLEKPNFYAQYGKQGLYQLVAFSQTDDPATARNSYYALAKYYEEGINLDYPMMLYHLNFPSVLESVVALMLNIKDLPVSLSVSSALIEAAKKSENAGVLLQKYAETSINQANLFLYDNSWVGCKLPTADDSLKLLLILYKYLPIRPVISSTAFFGNAIKFFIETKSPFTLVSIIVLLRRSDLNRQKVLALSQQGVFEEFFKVGLSLQDATLMHNLFVLTDTLVRTQYVPEIKIMIPKFFDYLVNRDQQFWQLSYQVFLSLSQIEDSAKCMKELGASSFFDNDNTQQGQIIARNLKKF